MSTCHEKILSVAVARPPYHCFDYLPPKMDDQTDFQPGIRVNIPFGNSECAGMIVAVKTESDYPVEKLKRVLQTIDAQPVLKNNILKLLTWASHYYHHPIGNVIASALPTLLRKGKPAVLKEVPVWKVQRINEEQSPEIPANAHRQKQLLDFISQHPKGVSQYQLADLEFDWRAPMKSCEKKQWVTKTYQPLLLVDHLATSPPPDLNSDQKNAVNCVTKSLDKYTTYVLDGVTGSGKTEVYLHIIHEILALQQQVLILIPEIGLTPQLLSRFQKRFPLPIVTLHSAMTDQQRLNSWLLAESGEARIVIGTRSAVYCPFDNLGMIIIDEEHDASFKQQTRFRYHARDLAVYRAMQENIPIMLGTATPSFETLHNIHREKYTWLELTNRAGKSISPDIKLIDLKTNPVTKGLTKPIKSAIELALSKQEQVLIFINRRGYSPILLCHHCGWSANCRDCDAKLTYHESDNKLRCHHCAKEHFVPQSCPDCQAKQLKMIGLGTQRVEKYCHEMFPDTDIIRIDRDSTQKKGAFENILSDIKAGKNQILIGTQMLAKGHHFPNLTLVCILDIDSGLLSGDFRAMERMAQQLIQTSGRAGRAEKSGVVLIQTHYPDHPSLITLIRNGYQKYSNIALQERQEANLPPYSAQALLRAEAKNSNLSMQFLHEAKSCFQKVNMSSVQCMGPIPSLMEKKKGLFRAQLLIEAPHKQAMQSLLNKWSSQIQNQPSAKKVRWFLDIDPLDVL
jgi:primosomal protein N' (replication factor Y) (superfamily II helicase)